MSLPGFLPEIGNTFGQSRGGGLKPGLDFAFGAVNESYIRRAAERGWLLRTDSIITPRHNESYGDIPIPSNFGAVPRL